MIDSYLVGVLQDHADNSIKGLIGDNIFFRTEETCFRGDWRVGESNSFRLLWLTKWTIGCFFFLWLAWHFVDYCFLVFGRYAIHYCALKLFCIWKTLILSSLYQHPNPTPKYPFPTQVAPATKMEMIIVANMLQLSFHETNKIKTY